MGRLTKYLVVIAIGLLLYVTAIAPYLTGLVVLAVYVAHGLHELTHYVFARLVGRPARFVVHNWPHIFPLAVDHMGPSEITKGDVLIHAGPLLVGAIACLVYVVLYWSWPSLPVFVGWTVYTLIGVRNDSKFVQLDELETHTTTE